MKKVIFGFFILTLMFATSCKKTTTTSAYGSWTFKGTTYNGITHAQVGGGSGVEVVSTTNSFTIGFSPALTASGTVAPGSFTVSLGSSSGAYTSINPYNGGSTGSVSATVSGGDVNASSIGSGVMMYNASNGADSAYVTFSGIN